MAITPDALYEVHPAVIELAKSIYDATADFHGLIVPPFNAIGLNERAPFVSSAARVLIAFNPHPRGRIRIAKTVKSEPKPPRFEIWTANSAPIATTDTIASALAIVPWQLPSIRVRTFYDRIRKRRIVQFFCGSRETTDITSTAKALTRAALAAYR